MKRFLLAFPGFLLVLLVTACTLPDSTVNATEPAPIASPASFPSPEITPVSIVPAPQNLTICLGQEPNTLYPYGNPNSAARSVLAALYDGPVDVFLDGYQPVILQDIPTLENGDVQINPITVNRGDLVVDIDDQLVLLDAGVLIFPAGCNDESCAVNYGGQGEIQMDQLVATFRLLPQVLWSDGTPVTAQDSVYSFLIASDSATPGSKYLVDRTQTYEAVDEKTVQWWGRPGYSDPTYADNFFAPFPEHAWKSLSAADLARADLTARPPLGWGPYVFEAWVPGEAIRFSKNLNYFRAQDTLPAFETLRFLFLQNGEAAISAILAGDCDLLDTSLRLESQLDLLKELESKQSIKIWATTTSVMERFDFGIRPASYDDGVGVTDRINLFADVRTRQAVAYCLNRQEVVDTVLFGLSTVPATFIAPAHPAYNENVALYPYDINKGISLLEEAGWLDDDGDPATARVAKGAVSVPDGTQLSFSYQTSQAAQRRQVSEILATSLRECGIGVESVYRSANDLYAPGPQGPLFGRQFDVAVYAVGVSGVEPACAPYTSDEIPTDGSNWLGLNIMGYDNSDFDALCQKARRALPDQPEYLTQYAQLQSIFANDLPSIPLYARVKVAAARADLCNFSLSPNNLFDLWNLEEFEIDSTCINPE